MRTCTTMFVSLLFVGPVVAKPLTPIFPPFGSSLLAIQGTLPLKENAIQGRRVATDAESVTQILFADGTTLTLGRDSATTIDSFHYDPATGSARLQATLERGAFRFIGGRTSKTPGGVNLTTAFGTLSIENASVEISLGDNGAAHFDLVFGDSLSLLRGEGETARAHRAGYSIVPGSNTEVRKTPPEWKRELTDRLSARRAPQ